jgi:hypothetical protein
VDVGLDGLVGVVGLPELDHVDADDLLVDLQVHADAVADVLGAGAVVAQDDLVADVDGGEAGRRGVDVEQVVELVLGELGDLRRAKPVTSSGRLGGRRCRSSHSKYSEQRRCISVLDNRGPQCTKCKYAHTYVAVAWASTSMRAWRDK